MAERARSAIEEYYVRSGATAETLAEVREALAREGWRGYRAWEAEHFPYFTYRARAYASLGRNADAVRALEESYRAHERFLPWFILADPVFDPLHDEPGFQELVRLMDLPH